MYISREGQQLEIKEHKFNSCSEWYYHGNRRNTPRLESYGAVMSTKISIAGVDKTFHIYHQIAYAVAAKLILFRAMLLGYFPLKFFLQTQSNSKS